VGVLVLVVLVLVLDCQ